MSRTPVGTRFTTGCGHSWKRRYHKWTAGELRRASTDCNYCGSLLLIVIPDDMPDHLYPANVHCPLFHAQLAKETDGLWPADGAGTFSVGFSPTS
jgi:hypothetical protein